MIDALMGATTPSKLFYDSVLRGKKEPITERDFSDTELQAMRGLVGTKPEGSIGYGDYGQTPFEQPGVPGLATPQGRVANSLGQFNYKADPEGINISDNYDFNPTFSTENPMVQALSAAGTGGFSALHRLGEKFLPEGQGRPVNIRLQTRWPNE